jgi:peptide/nickel transport system ATP-binding protein
MTAPLLQIDALNVAIRDTPLLNGVSLEIAAGEVLGLVGASGSGKSMTALAVLQLLPAGASMSGSVRLRGQALDQSPPAAMRAVRGRDIGMVFQEPMTALNPLMSIGAQVAETVRLHGKASADDARRLARAALDAVGLSGEQGAWERLPYELSGGQRQRVAIAIAIVLSPPLLIADEPTTALDVIAQAQILKLLKGLSESRGMGLLFITHDLAVLSQLAQRVAVMHQGEIVEQGATADVLLKPRHAYTQALLSASARAPRRVRRPLDFREILQATGIVKEYPRRRRSLFHTPPPLRAVDHVSLKVHPGETVGLVGESGSGKSSLLKVILALQRAQQGSVLLLGEEFSINGGARLRHLRRAISVVFQDPVGSFDGRWSVERIIAEPLHLLDNALTPAERGRKVAEALEQVGLQPADAARLPHEFSGGQRQRIAIARALITQPALIAFDEAVSALDVLMRDQILKLLAGLAVRTNLAYLFVSHDLQVIRAIADRVYVMHQGRIVEEGATEVLFNAPRDPYTRALIEATPRLP